MELSQLRYFIAVVEAGQYVQGRRDLVRLQPNLSTSISRLEEEVGVPLFERRRGKIALNQNGELLLISVEQAVSLLDAGVQAVRNQHSGRPEPLSIVCMTDDTTLLEHFCAEHPEVNSDPQRLRPAQRHQSAGPVRGGSGHDGAPGPVGRGGL